MSQHFAHPLRTLTRAVSALLFIGIGQAFAATPYRFDELGTAPARGVFTPYDLNDTGLVVGGYTDVDASRHQGFLYQDGYYTTLLGSVSTSWIEPRAVNNAGLVAGYYTNLVMSSYSSGFMLDHGALSFFTGVDVWGTQVTGMNNVGQIVGWNPIDWFGTGFIYTPATGALTSLYDIGLVPGDINDYGALVGRQQYEIFSDDTNYTLAQRPVIYANGQSHIIRIPGAAEDQIRPYGINNAGTVSGFFADALGGHGFVLADGQLSVLDAPGAVPGGTQVYGINNFGQVTGFFVDGEGITHGFVATPVPEPMSAVLMLVGLASVGVGLRLRARA